VCLGSPRRARVAWCWWRRAERDAASLLTPVCASVPTEPAAALPHGQEAVEHPCDRQMTFLDHLGSSWPSAEAQRVRQSSKVHMAGSRNRWTGLCLRRTPGSSKLGLPGAGDSRTYHKYVGYKGSRRGKGIGKTSGEGRGRGGGARARPVHHLVDSRFLIISTTCDSRDCLPPAIAFDSRCSR